KEIEPTGDTPSSETHKPSVEERIRAENTAKEKADAVQNIQVEAPINREVHSPSHQISTVGVTEIIQENKAKEMQPNPNHPSSKEEEIQALKEEIRRMQSEYIDLQKKHSELKDKYYELVMGKSI
ncbi:MAG: hypothetical protein AAFW00_15635, partial [Bacteroidota bacterium]